MRQRNSFESKNSVKHQTPCKNPRDLEDSRKVVKTYSDGYLVRTANGLKFIVTITDESNQKSQCPIKRCPICKKRNKLNHHKRCSLSLSQKKRFRERHRKLKDEMMKLESKRILRTKYFLSRGDHEGVFTDKVNGRGLSMSSTFKEEVRQSSIKRKR